MADTQNPQDVFDKGNLPADRMLDIKDIPQPPLHDDHGIAIQDQVAHDRLLYDLYLPKGIGRTI